MPETITLSLKNNGEVSFHVGVNDVSIYHTASLVTIWMYQLFSDSAHFTTRSDYFMCTYNLKHLKIISE